MIPICEPYLCGNEKKYLKECIKTNWISSQGEFITRFEESIAEYHDVKHGIVTSNCTTALHLSLLALGIGPGDEVICPSLTFIAPANMIILSGAKLILVDVDSDTLNINPDLIEEKITCNTKAIIVVHQFGHACPMDEIQKIASKYNLKILEDNAESIGGKYKGKLLGTFGTLSTFSFFANKIITSGEGGAIITNDDEIAVMCRELRDHGMSLKKRYHHVNLGYNYRMTNMQAAIGLGQFEKLDEILEIRNDQMEYYYKVLENIETIKVRSFKPWCNPVHWLLTLTLDDKYNRDEFLNYFKNNGIDCRQMINPVYHAEHLINKYNKKEFPISENISRQSVHLPSSTSLTKENIDNIVSFLKKFLRTK